MYIYIYISYSYIYLCIYKYIYIFIFCISHYTSIIRPEAPFCFPSAPSSAPLSVIDFGSLSTPILSTPVPPGGATSVHMLFPTSFSVPPNFMHLYIFIYIYVFILFICSYVVILVISDVAHF